MFPLVLWWDKYSAQGGLNEQFVYILGNNLPNSLENKYKQTENPAREDGIGQTVCGCRIEWDFFLKKQSHAHLYTKLSVCDM